LNNAYTKSIFYPTETQEIHTTSVPCYNALKSNLPREKKVLNTNWFVLIGSSSTANSPLEC